MPKAIIHTATRVIRRFTVDVTPELASDESAVDIADPIVLPASSTGFYKLDATNAIVEALISEANAAGVNEAFEDQQRRNRLLALRDAAIAMRDDPAVPTTSADFARKLVQFLHVTQ